MEHNIINTNDISDDIANSIDDYRNLNIKQIIGGNMDLTIKQKRTIQVSESVHESLTMLKYKNHYGSINTVIERLLWKEIARQQSLQFGGKDETQSEINKNDKSKKVP